MSEPMIEMSEREPERRDPVTRKALLVAVVAVVSLLIGSGAAASAMWLLGWRPPQEREYTVSVLLKTDVTAEQKAAVEAAFDRIPNSGEPRFTTKAEALVRMKELFKDRPTFLSALTEAAAPESYEVRVRTTEIGCEGITELATMPGVSVASVGSPATMASPPVKILCF